MYQHEKSTDHQTLSLQDPEKQNLKTMSTEIIDFFLEVRESAFSHWELEIALQS